MNGSFKRRNNGQKFEQSDGSWSRKKFHPYLFITVSHFNGIFSLATWVVVCKFCQLFLWFRNIRKAGIKIFPFHLIFFVRWSVSSIISGYVRSVPVWLRIFSRFCKWVPQAPIQSSVDVLNSVLLWEFSFPGTLRETSFVSWALASLVEIEANKSGAVVDFTPSLYM